MIYFIKFVYSFVLPPGIFVVLLLAMALWLWKKNRRPALTLLAVTLLLYLSMTSFASDLLIGSLEKKYTQPAAVDGDVIVVLGGGAVSGTPDLDGAGNLSGPAANRLLTAVRLYRQSGLPVIFSGGQVFADSGNEADIARRQLIGLGIPSGDILAENRSLNTDENAVNTARLMQEHGFSRPVLVTSAFHMARSMEQFKNAGLSPQPFPTDYQASRPISLYVNKFTPSGGAVSTTALALKEYLGLLAARLLP
ncbi:YdcF family protein [Paenibacillus sp. MMS20-IR301]|uniref:YdcF family protein n=1 Tax=Paenibacillus sp. MMS20-IR301 TaxID=2895946 RepID=UPI0028F0D72C|nr:YdcF family protein [Paenibacillus sp. MMS20-IR301]WNS46851.1 YdcF family protein [Paenibacillus sp. MMS20-IR301]